MTLRVVFSPTADQQLADLFSWIEEASGFADQADEFVSSIIDHCEILARFPHIGVARDDLRLSVRTINFQRRVTIAYAFEGEMVEILGVFYAGRDYETLLSADLS